jgi:hypothetical protein
MEVPERAHAPPEDVMSNRHLIALGYAVLLPAISATASVALAIAIGALTTRHHPRRAA